MLATAAAWREREPTAFTQYMHELATISSRGIDALTADDAAAFLSSLRDYATALARFGAAAGVDIASREHRSIAAIAETCGCVYKSCGAGGGDVGVTFAVEDTRLRAFSERASRAGFPVIGLEADPKGLEVVSNV
jgi:phosphomevalonate kinase